MSVNSLRLRPYEWNIEDKKSCYGGMRILAYCLNDNGKPCLVRIEDYFDTIYIELPLIHNQYPINWDINKAGDLHAFILKALPRNMKDDLLPFQTSHCVLRRTLYEFKVPPISRNNTPDMVKNDIIAGKRVEFPMLEIHCKNKSLSYRIRDLLKVPFQFNNLKLEFKVYHVEIDTIVKLLTSRNIRHSSWITNNNTYYIPNDNSKISTLENEYIIPWNVISKVPKNICKDWIATPSIMGFDLEAYSHKHRCMPNKDDPRHHVTCMSVTYAKQGARKDERIRYIIVLGDINEIPEERFKNVTVIRVRKQPEIVHQFARLIHLHNPQAILSYNGLNFDYDYLNGRLHLYNRDWPIMGMLLDVKTTVTKTNGSESAAYGVNRDCSVLMPGRLNLDLFKIVKRDFKFPTFKLNAVAAQFNLGGKDDITAQFMFRSYERLVEASKHFDKVFPESGLPLLKEVVYRIYKYIALDIEVELERLLTTIDHNFATWVKNPDFIQRLNEVIKNAECNGFNSTQYEAALDDMTTVAIYCIQDVELCFDIFEHLNVWVGAVEISNIVGVSMIDLYKGQQRRCESQLYRLCFKKNIVMDMRPVTPIPFVGGKVFDPIVGLHDLVLVLDFKSLYPMIMIAYNICYMSFISKVLWKFIPEDWCNIIKVDCDENINPDLDVEGLDEEEIEDIKLKGKQYANGNKGKYEFRFLKSEICPGILPELVRKLVDKRDLVVKHINDNKMNKKSGQGLVLDKRQLGLKVSANSFYGFLGVLNNGKRPFREAAISITALGREAITRAVEYVVGKYNAILVYGDTDSCMIKIPGVTDPAVCEMLMDQICAEISALFPKPMQIKPEYAARMLALMKKKYLMMPHLPPKSFRRDVSGNVLPDGWFMINEKTGRFIIESKGCLTARRDNCKWAKDVFTHTAYSIMTRESFVSVIEYLADSLSDLIDGKVSYENFVITRAIRDNYKSKTYFMKVFSDVLSSLGTPVQAGERLPYIVYHNPQASSMGNRMMLLDRYLSLADEPNPPQIDYLYYVDKILTSPIDQLLNAAYTDDINTLNAIKYKRSNRHKTLGMNTFIGIAVQMIKDNHNIKKLKDMIIDQHRTMELISNFQDINNQFDTYNQYGFSTTPIQSNYML